jgi:hypothetical protein
MSNQLPLVGLTEIAQRAGVRKQAVAMWRTRHPDFPRPVAELHTGAVWWWPHVRSWLRRTGRNWDERWTVEQVNASEKRNHRVIEREVVDA